MSDRTELLAAVGLERISAAAAGVDFGTAAAYLELAGRPQLLGYLKEAGVAKLSERQALAGGVGKAVKLGLLSATALPAAAAVDPTRRLLRAAANGDDATAGELLQVSGREDGWWDDKEGSALMAACASGREVVVRLLLRPEHAGAAHLGRPRESDGMTAVMLAARGGHADCMDHLLAAQADVDATNREGWTALMLACQANAPAVVAALVHAGASPTCGVHNGWAVVLTPLKLACIGGHARCVELLLGARAHIDENDGSRMDIVEADGSTMLIYAAQRTHCRTPMPGDGHSQTVRLLLEARASVDPTRWDGLTPLAYAAIYGDLDSASSLLAAGASPSRADEAGWTPILWAARGGHEPCVRLLLQRRARADEARPNGCTALMMAALAGSVATIDALLSAGADVHATMSAGRRLSALMLAGQHGHASAARRLLEARASPSQSDATGWSAARHAAHRGHALCAQLLGLAADTSDGAEVAAAEVATAEPAALAAAAAEPAVAEAALHFGPIAHLSHLDSWHERVTSARGEASATAAAATVHAGAGGASAGRGTAAGRALSRHYCCSSSHPHFANLLQMILLEHGYERAPGADAPWELLWFAGPLDPLMLRRMAPGQRVNKFPNSSCLTTKSQLWRTFERMRRRHGRAHFGFVPDSYVLPDEADRLRACMAAGGAAEANGGEGGGGGGGEGEGGGGGGKGEGGGEGNGEHSARTAAVWIVKPVAACRGQGITLHRSADGLPPEVGGRSGIGSVYVHPPYLIGGRKVDLRLYVLVTSWRPLVVYLHDAGLARIATEPYALTDLSHVQKHLTNYSINKHASPAPGGAAEAEAAEAEATAVTADAADEADVCNAPEDAPEDAPADAPEGAPEGAPGRGGSRHEEPPSGPKLSLGAFRARLALHVGEERAAAAWRAVNEAIVKLLIGAEPTMGQAVATYLPPNGARCFQLFGFDIMLDAHCQPWVLEVNLDPALATDARLDLEVKAAVLTDTLNVVGVGAAPAATARAHGDVAAGVAADAAADSARPASAGSGLHQSQREPAREPRAGSDSREPPSASEAQLVRDIDAELARAQQGGWRRLHPSARGEYARFFEPSRVRLNSLPYAEDVCDL